MSNRVLNLKKGDKCIVAVEKGSNMARYYNKIEFNNIDEWTYEGIVTISNKNYITVDFGKDICKFTVDDDYRQKYRSGGADYKLYKDKEEIYETFRKEELLSDLFGLSFNRPNKIKTLTLEQLERINSIIEENN